MNDVWLIETPAAAPADVTLGEQIAVPPPPPLVGGSRRRHLPPEPVPLRRARQWEHVVAVQAHTGAAVVLEVRPVGRWLTEEILELV